MVESVARSRIDPKVKKEASHIFQKMGLTMSDAIRLRLFLVQAIAEKRLPFDVRLPNIETVKAMEEIR